MLVPLLLALAFRIALVGHAHTCSFSARLLRASWEAYGWRITPAGSGHFDAAIVIPHPRLVGVPDAERYIVVDDTPQYARALARRGAPVELFNVTMGDAPFADRRRPVGNDLAALAVAVVDRLSAPYQNGGVP